MTDKYDYDDSKKAIDTQELSEYLRKVLSNSKTQHYDEEYVNDKIQVFISRCHQYDWSSYASVDVSMKSVMVISKELLDADTENELFNLIINGRINSENK